MLPARGLIALLEVAQRARGPGLSLGSAAACQPVGQNLAGTAAAAWSSWSALASPTAAAAYVSSAACKWRGLHITAAAAAAGGEQAAAAGAAQQAGPAAAAAAGGPSSQPAKIVLYRGKGMRLFRLLVRMKVFQLAGIAALAVPINTFLATGSVATPQAVMAGALVVGAGVASTALWYYSRRYVGELALLPAAGPDQPPRVRLSVLDFWGNREDNDVALQALVPPLANLPGDAARRAVLAEPLLPVDVEGDRQYFLRYGSVVDSAALQALLSGQLDGQALWADGDDLQG